jgi:membrane associated rhomboid family serine protease
VTAPPPIGPGSAGSAGPTVAPRCPRHPDRETGLACTRCGRPACPDCLRPAPVGMHCVDCVAASARTTRATRTAFGAPERATTVPVVTTTLIAINVVVFVLTALSAGSAWSNYLSPWVDATWLVPADVAEGQWWRLVTSGFLHLGPLHVAFNMFALWVIGRDLELVLGRLRFVVLYGVSLLGGSAAIVLLGDPGRPVAGASGAVFGLMGALAVVIRRVRLSPGPVLITIVINIVLTFTIPGLSVLGHLGGLLVGALVAACYVYGPARSRPALGLVLAGVVAAVLLVLILVKVLLLT